MSRTSNGRIEIVSSCPNFAIHIECPPLKCGTRVLAYDEYNFSYNIDKSLKKRNPNEEEELGIVSGQDSQLKSWPSLVGIYRDGEFHCGGNIINEIWILTAAHCLEGFDRHYYEIEAGVLRRFSFSPMGQNKKAVKIFIHPNYNPDVIDNDVGLMKLDSPLKFNRWVRPSCLPSSITVGHNWKQEPRPGTHCTTVGWGMTFLNKPERK